MIRKESSTRTDDPVEALFTRFREAYLVGEAEDPEQFLDRHACCDPELRTRIDNFLRVMRALPAAARPAGAMMPSGPAGKDSLAGQTVGDFRLVREIGRGGMGVVYEAEQVSLRRKVALKILPPHMGFSREARMKFRREAEAGGRQSHPGIVAVHTVGEAEGTHYIAQELVSDGVTLADRLDTIRQEGGFPTGHIRRAAGIVADVADALSHAHASGVIHRDVKPSNILITREGQPKVTDFGLARVEDALVLSRSGDLAGTPYYMSPEQASGQSEKIDFRTDIFSLGVTLYESLTLARPFDGKTSQEILRRIVSREPRYPSSINPRIPRDLAVICLKAMEKVPKHRYADMMEFGADIRRFLAGETIQARRTNVALKLWKRMKRKPAVSAALILSVVVLVMGLMYTVLFSESKQRDREDRNYAAIMNKVKQSADALGSDPTGAINLALEAADLLSGYLRKGQEKSARLLVNNALLAALPRNREYRRFQTGAASYASFSPDGTNMIATTCDGRVRLFDLATAQEIAPPSKLGVCPSCAVLTPDGRLLAVGTEKGEVRIVEVRDAGRLIGFFENGGFPVRSLSFDGKSERLIVASDDMTARVLDAATGRELRVFAGHGWRVSSASFSSDGTRIVTASEDSVARIWDVTSGEKIAVYDERPNALCSGEFSPRSGSSEVLLVYEDGVVVIWDFEVPAAEAVSIRLEEGIRCVAFSPDGDSIAVALNDRIVRILGASSWRKANRSFTGSGEGVQTKMEEAQGNLQGEGGVFLRGHQKGINSVAFDRSGSRLVTASDDGTTRIWDVKAGIVGYGPRRGWSNAGVEPGGRFVARVSKDRKKIAILDTESGKDVVLPMGGGGHRDKEIRRKSPGENLIYVIPVDADSITWWEVGEVGSGASVKKWRGSQRNRDAVVKGLVFSDRGTTLAAHFTLNLIRVWDLETRRALCLLAHSKDIDSLAIDPRGERLAIALSDHTVRIWNVSRGEQIHRLSGHENEIFEAVFSSDGTRILTASHDGTVRIWDTRLGKEASSFVIDRNRNSPVALSPCGKLAAAALQEGSVHIWETGSGNEVASQRFSRGEADVEDGIVCSLEFSQCGKRLAVGTTSTNASAFVWNMETGSLTRLAGHDEEIRLARFCLDGSIVVTLANDGAARLWDAEEGDEIALLPQGNAIRFASFSSDSREVVTSTEDGPVQVWPTDPITFARTYCCENNAMERREDLESRERNGRDGDTETAKDLHQFPLLRDRVILQTSETLPKEEVEPFLFTGHASGATEETGRVLVEGGIWLFDPKEGESIKRLYKTVNSQVRVLAVSPGGNRVCFSELVFDDQGFKERYDVKVAAFAKTGGRLEPRTVYTLSGKHVNSLAWGRNGARVYLTTSNFDLDDCDDRVCWIDPDGDPDQKPHTILRRPGATFAQMDVSPRRELICFTHYPGRSNFHDQEIWVAHLVEDISCAVQPRRLTRNSRGECGCFFSGDGLSIAAYSLQGSGAEVRPCLVRLKVNDSLGCSLHEEIVLEAAEMGEIGGLAISKSGKIAFSTPDKFKIVVVDPRDGRCMELTYLEIKKAGSLSYPWNRLSYVCFIEE